MIPRSESGLLRHEDVEARGLLAEASPLLLPCVTRVLNPTLVDRVGNEHLCLLSPPVGPVF